HSFPKGRANLPLHAIALGLTGLFEQLQQIELDCDNQHSFEKISNALTHFLTDFKQKLPSVIRQYQKLTES
ncbi:hypothetical protein, partial [Runella sp.]